MKKILIATEKPFAPVAIKQIKEIIEKAGYKLELLENYADQSALVKAASDANALIVRSDIVDKALLGSSQNLEIIVRAGAGYDNIDLEAATENNMIVMNTPGQNSNAVAELVFGMMVFDARKKFAGVAGTELRNKNLGIHAYGYVGRIVAMIGKGFGMNVSAFDPFIDKVIIENDGVKRLASAEELYAHNQYISLHIPANDETKKSINFDLLSRMPNGATLVNTARKEVIDEDSLLKMFNDRKDFHYLTDIQPACHQELADKYPDRYFATPKKMGAQTSEANVNAGVAAAVQIVNFFTKGDKTFQVN